MTQTEYSLFFQFIFESEKRKVLTQTNPEEQWNNYNMTTVILTVCKEFNVEDVSVLKTYPQSILQALKQFPTIFYYANEILKAII